MEDYRLLRLRKAQDQLSLAMSIARECDEPLVGAMISQTIDFLRVRLCVLEG